MTPRQHDTDFDNDFDKAYDQELNDGFEDDDVDGPRMEPHLLERFGARIKDGPIVIAARYSTPSGRRAREMAVADLYEAVRAFAEYTGIDAEPFLPDAEILCEQLSKGDKVKSKSENGASFTNQFLEIDLISEIGIYLVVSTGSAKKTDETLLQPFLTRLEAIARATGASALFSYRLDRIVRKAWALGPLMLLAESKDMWIGDSRRGPRPYTSERAKELFDEADQAEKGASLVPVQTMKGKRRRTQRQMREGRAVFAFGAPGPPGLMTVRMRDGAGLGARMLIIDSPVCWPDPNEVATGLPEVYGDNGLPVDQVENVRWALANLARPGWSESAVGEQLVLRLWTTDTIRRAGGLSATASMNGNVHSYVATIVKNLSVYETEWWRVPESDAYGKPPIYTEGICPPDGLPWASPEDFARIRAWRENGLAVSNAAVNLTFTGLRATVAGLPEQSFTSHLSGAGHRRGKAMYAQVDSAAKREGTIKVARHGLLVPAAEFGGSIAEGLARAADAPLASLMSAGGHLSPEELQLTIQHRSRDAARAHLAQRVDRLKARVTEEDVDGNPVLHGQLLTDLNTKYNSLAVKLAEAAADVAKLDRQLRTARDRRLLQRGGAAAEMLLKLVASLRDPMDLGYRATWLTVLRDVVVDKLYETLANGLTRRSVTWSGTLVLQGAESDYLVPFEGSYILDDVEHEVSSVDRIIGGLAAGRSYWTIEVLGIERLRPAVAARLGYSSDRFPLASCVDPRILRAATAIRRGERTLIEIAEDLGEAVRFVERLAQVHGVEPGAAHWARPGSVRLVQVHVYAATNAGVVDRSGVNLPNFGQVRRLPLERGGWTSTSPDALVVEPCQFCGSVALAPMTIPEPDGHVCLQCRRDRSGLKWASDPYDAYIDLPDLWQACGLLSAHIPSPPAHGRVNVRPSLRRKARQPSDFAPEQRKRILRAYRDRSIPVLKIRDDEGVSVAELYRLGDDAGIPRRGRWTGPRVPPGA